MGEKLAEVLLTRAPELVGLIWSIWFFGGKIDRLTSALAGLREDLKVLLERVDHLS